jgi:hypothetical protein
VANPTLVEGATTLTFHPGQFVVRRIPDSPRQRKLVSSDGTVRVLEVSTTDDRFLEVVITALPSADGGGFSGRNSLRTFILTNLNWAETTATLTDADSDSLTVRFWGDELDLQEAASDQERKDQWSGRLLFRVEV